MKNLFLIITAFLFCSLSSIALSETMEDLVKRDGLYYKKFTDTPFTGKVEGKKQGSFKNGKKHGKWIIYHENGQLAKKFYLKNGKVEGEAIAYYDNGELWHKGQFKNSKKDGEWIIYHHNGQLMDKAHYKNGKSINK